jgi:hypothetical protein
MNKNKSRDKKANSKASVVSHPDSEPVSEPVSDSVSGSSSSSSNVAIVVHHDEGNGWAFMARETLEKMSYEGREDICVKF